VTRHLPLVLAPLLAATACALPSAVVPSAAEAGAITVTAVTARVPDVPIPVLGEDDRTHLLYEIALVNQADTPAVVERVEVLDGGGVTVGDVSGAELALRMKPAGGVPPGPDLAPGQAGMVFVHVALPAGAAVPDRLQQRVTTTMAGATQTAVLAETGVDDQVLPTFGPPLLGEGYLAADGCCGADRHTRIPLPLNGSMWVSQRFAIDWEQLDAAGRIYDGPRDAVTSYPIYGDEIHSMSGGTVVAAHDGAPDETPGAYPDPPNILTGEGNHVVVDVGGGGFLTYSHMKPGSVRVRPGDVVAEGDVLGLVGNSGNTIVPHLHVQFTDGPSLASNGRPYLMRSFTLTGRIVGTEAFDAAESNGTPAQLVPGVTPTEYRDRLVLDMGIVTLSR
jgi:hypothetical protein